MSKGDIRATSFLSNAMLGVVLILEHAFCVYAFFFVLDSANREHYRMHTMLCQHSERSKHTSWLGMVESQAVFHGYEALEVGRGVVEQGTVISSEESFADGASSSSSIKAPPPQAPTPASTRCPVDTHESMSHPVVPEVELGREVQQFQNGTLASDRAFSWLTQVPVSSHCSELCCCCHVTALFDGCPCGLESPGGGFATASLLDSCPMALNLQVVALRPSGALSG